MEYHSCLIVLQSLQLFAFGHNHTSGISNCAYPYFKSSKITTSDMLVSH